MRLWLIIACSLLLLMACKQKPNHAAVPLSREEKMVKNLELLKKEVTTGDLIVRLGDDLLSYQIKFLNEKEQNYSHAGIIIERDGKQLIAHITPDDPKEDRIQFTPIDSFLNPTKNLFCAAYRYNFTVAEKDSFAAAIISYKTAGVRFDKVYDLNTEQEMYCSEMISKAVEKATQKRIYFRQINVPERMRPALYRHFNKQLTKQTIAQRKIMTIDNLYRIRDCRLIMQFQLKFFPGE